MIDIEDIHYIFDQLRPVVSHIEVSLPEKLLTPKSIGEDLKGPKRQFWEEALFVKYYKNKNVSLILDPIPIKYLPDETNFIHSIIASIIK